MELIWREKPDGTRGFAYPVYLAAMFAALGVIALLHRRLAPAVAAAGGNATRGKGRGAQVGGVTAAAALVTPVRAGTPAPAPGTTSYRLTPERGRAAQVPVKAGGLEGDPIAAVLEPPGGASPADGAAFAALPPAFAGEGAAAHANLLGYRDPDADGATGSAAHGPAAPVLPWIARGTLVPVYLLTTVDTSNPAAVLQFGVAQDVWAHGKRRLRFGTRLLGKLSGRPMRGRLALAADTVVYADGRERGCSASVVEADERGSDIRPGVASTYIAPPAWARATPYVSDFATGFLGLLQARAQPGLAIGVAGANALTLQTSVGDDARGPAYQASAQAITDYTKDRLREIEERYAGYYLVPAGTACWLEFEADFTGAIDHEP